MRILLIDDEQVYYKMLEKALRDAGYQLEYASSGKQGLAAVAKFKPEIIITDLRMPDLDGFEVVQRIRRDPLYAQTPVIFTTSKSALEDKLKAFELGADDYVVKPFEPEELVARVNILARRTKTIKLAKEKTDAGETISHIVAVHSLRGGVGCSTLAVNLALAFNQIWVKKTTLIDTVFSAGQIAMMLNATPRTTWEDLIGFDASTFDETVLDNLAGRHVSGIHYIAAPRYPIAGDTFSSEFWQKVFDVSRLQDDFIVVDLPHDFSDLTITALNAADYVLLVIAPEMASLRAVVGAIRIYEQLGYSANKIKLVMNNNSNQIGIKQSQLEKVLDRPIDFVVPYEPKEVYRSINFGEPFVLKLTDLPATIQIENMAYNLSNNILKSIPPAAPTPTWKRVTSRLEEW